jgi:hypothetical protein
MSRYGAWRLLRPGAGPKPNKYGAKMTRVDGILFDSKAEAKRYGELKLMRDAKLIEELTTHPSFPIDHNDNRICVVELDFKYIDIKRRHWIYEDVKGKDNPLSALKRKLVEAFYGIKVEIVR